MVHYKFLYCIVLYQLWGTGARAPSTSNNLIFFPVHFPAAESLTVTLCSCLSKHTCIIMCLFST